MTALTARWRKVLGDLWHGRTRAALVVVAIAIGLTGFFAVLSTYAVLRRELNRGYLATNPASAVLATDAVDEALLAAVRARADVADADSRAVVKARLRTGAGTWRRLTLFALRDFRNLRIDTVTPEAGAWPPPPGGLLIERDAFQVAKAKIGDEVTIEVKTGSERRLRVVGGVHDAGQAQARMENAVYGYVTKETLAALGEPPVLDRLYLLAGGDRFDPAHVRQVAASVKVWLESSGHAVKWVQVPPPGKHPHAEIMGLLLLAMAAFGLFALALSGVIVVNLLLARMAAERRQIGVMKALGATRGQIGRIYLAEAGLLGVAALAIATPAGLVAGRLLSHRFAVLLNFDLASLAVPLWVWLLVAVVGLLVPLAAAAYPVASGTAVTVRTALAATGVDPASFGARRLDRLVSGVGAAGRPWLLGVRNSLRRRARTALTLATLAVAGALFISALSFRASMMATLDRLFGAGTFGSIERYAFDQHMLMIYVFLIVVAFVLAAVGGLGLMTATSLNVLDRRRELAVLRAIGATPARVAGIVVVEAVFVALLACLVALLAAWPITAGLGAFVTAALLRGGLDVTLSLPGIFGWLALSTALSVVASLAPAVSTSSRSIREEISYE
ncbi:MAG TPA: FtsX-like permease family protein [Thermoanaerobaculia bacterium]|nr:FtsX-like permease family protein [Thermoanaerobaculia bacterium]